MIRWTAGGFLALCLLVPAMGWAGPGSGGRAMAAESQEKLLESLKSGSLESQREAIVELGQTGNDAAVPTIVEVLRAGDPVLQQLAENALWSIWTRSGDPRVDYVLLDGTRLMAGGYLEEAIRRFDEVIRLRPDFAEGYNKRATALYHLGRFRRSLDDIDETLKRNPYHFGALSGAGLCMLKLERPEEAVIYFERALRIHPNLTGIINLKREVERRLRKPST